jgi:hypothetical protein
MVFHMSRSGRAVLGEPPPDLAGDDRHGRNGSQKAATKERKWEYALPEVTSVHLMALLGILLVAGVIYGAMVWGAPADNLSLRAQALVDALAKDNLDSVKSAAASGQSDDAVRFYENARQRLEPLRKMPGGGALLTSVMVVEMSPNSKKGQVIGIFVPSKAPDRTEKLATEAGMEKGAVEINLFWVTDSFGRWRLDAKKSLGG